MTFVTSPSETFSIGEIFTPIKWARWLLNEWGIVEKWIDGASICDPTAGNGVFALALFDAAKQRGVIVTKDMLRRICLIEWNADHLHAFTVTAKRDYGLQLPATSLRVCDVIIDTPRVTFDILVGNPPWANFADLPGDYKEQLKHHFKSAGLVPDRRATLLGSSRVDIAALVVEKALGILLKNGGSAHFFLPLSLFTGDSAHVGFRDYKALEIPFSIKTVFEFRKSTVFSGVGTAYCCAHFVKGKTQKFPVAYFREYSNGWKRFEARPLRSMSDQWRIIDPREGGFEHDRIDIRLAPNQRPRQGVNSCGAKDVFVFDHRPDFIDPYLLFPLATKEVWKYGGPTRPKRWVFLPYDQITGRPLDPDTVRNIRGYEYLKENKSRLEARKGTLIKSFINRGIWWAMLGVGPYSFTTYKVIWNAYGKSVFDPIILSTSEGQAWQGNQAMHAFIPCFTLAEAETVLASLKSPSIAILLSQLSSDGKCNWAQPGKMMKIISFDSPDYDQLDLFDTTP